MGESWSFDVKVGTVDAVLYAERGRLKIESGDSVLVDTRSLRSVDTRGGERLVIVWEDGGARLAQVVRVTSAPAVVACEKVAEMVSPGSWA